MNEEKGQIKQQSGDDAVIGDKCMATTAKHVEDRRQINDNKLARRLKIGGD